MTQQRRLEDRELSVLVVEPGLLEGGAGEAASDQAQPMVVRYSFSPDEEIRAVRPRQPGWRLDATAFLLDLATESEAVLVVGPELRRIERGEGGRELIERAALGAAAWRKERARALRRLELPDRLLAFSEELHRAQTLAAVHATLVGHVARVVGGFTGLVYMVEQREPGHEALYPAEHPGISGGLTDASLPAELRFGGPGLVDAKDVLRGLGSKFGNLAPIIKETGAATMPYVPLGDRGLLFIIERRDERVFEPEDWDLLRSLARQAELALDRIDLYERVHALSLTDPLTGLANRRKMEVVLEHTFASARRGQPLSVVMIDLDSFKEYNDDYGHLRGDDLLRKFAVALRDHVRGSDLVVRYGGDEFLIVMAGAAREDAELIIQRIRDSVVEIGFSAGIGEYTAVVNSPQELVDIADRDLYAGRRLRGSNGRNSRSRVERERLEGGTRP